MYSLKYWSCQFSPQGAKHLALSLCVLQYIFDYVIPAILIRSVKNCHCHCNVKNAHWRKSFTSRRACHAVPHWALYEDADRACTLSCERIDRAREHALCPASSNRCGSTCTPVSEEGLKSAKITQPKKK